MDLNNGERNSFSKTHLIFFDDSSSYFLMTPHGVGRNLEAIEEDCFVGEEVAIGKVAANSCLTLNIKKLKFSVEHDRVVITLNTIKH